MSRNFRCPKCKGTDYFVGQRNVVTGMGWMQSGKMKEFPICRNCDEIMKEFKTEEELKKQEAFNSRFAFGFKIAVVLLIAFAFVYDYFLS